MHFCLTGQYTPQALNAILENPTTNRQEAATKLIDDLADLDNLFGGGKDERGEAFPRLLAQQTQTATRFNGRAHRLILWKGMQQLREVQLELEVICEPMPIRNRFSDFNREQPRFDSQANPMPPDHTEPASVVQLPPECLAGSEGGAQVVVI